MTRFALLAALLAADPLTAAPSFVNDVVPVFTRFGCNQGSCHGKGAGQNGFRLSLRGYAPEQDHDWLTREFVSRRIDPVDPESSSLLLRKPAGTGRPRGRQALRPRQPGYKLLLAWIRAGAPGPDKADPTLVS